MVYEKAAPENDPYKVITIEAKYLSVNLTDLEESVDYIVWVRITVSRYVAYALFRMADLRYNDFSWSL